MPAATWKGSPADIERAIRDHVTRDLIAETADKTYRHLSLAAVRVRSFDLQEADVTEGAPLPVFWRVQSFAEAHLKDVPDANPRCADLVYDFGSSGAGEIRLSSTIHLPFRAERLHRIQVFLRPDDSWHKITFFWERNGKRFRAMRPFYLGDFQWTVVALQEYGVDDAPNKVRLWLPLKEESSRSEYERREDYVKLEMVIRRVDYWSAWWAKIQRNYRGALDYIPFWRYVATSVFLVILNIMGTILSCSLVAYAVARLRWPGRGFAFGLMLATMMIPPQVTMIPYFVIVKHLGWYNTLKPLWVASFFGNAFNIFLLRQFMKGIPRDLEDAARIDGCNFLQVYAYVIMPLIKPTLACIAIFTFMGVWNDFMGPLIYLSDQRLYPLSLGLYAFNVQAGGNYGMMMAGSLLMTLPVIAVFFFAQKYFIQGVTLTGMKG
jgi:multiple sugar transport system permease protein